MELECGYNQWYSNSLRDFYLYGDDDRRLYRRFEYSHRYNHGCAGYGCGTSIHDPYALYKHSIAFDYPYDNPCNRYWNSNGLANRCYGFVGRQCYHNKRYSIRFGNL